MKIGFSANGTMTEAEGGFLIDITVALDVADFPRALVSITHETKGPMDFKTTTVVSSGNKSFGLSGLATTTVVFSYRLLTVDVNFNIELIDRMKATF